VSIKCITTEIIEDEDGVAYITIEGDVHSLRKTINKIEKKDPEKHGLSIAITSLYNEIEKNSNKENKKKKNNRNK